MKDTERTNLIGIGGQAVIEGVFMKGPNNTAVALRKADGGISVRSERLKGTDKKYPILKLPFLRGMFILIDTMVLGVRALTFSADQMELDEDDDGEPSRFEKFFEKLLGDKGEQIAVYLSVALSLVLAVGLFMVLPTYLIRFLKPVAGGAVYMNIAEGLLRIGIFLGYVFLISRLKDIQRVFEYHGAEHKTIHCYERGDELTPENAAKYSRLHPRCGTSFLLIVMVVSIILFSFVGWPSIPVRVMSRILLMPLIGGISYEIIKWAGKKEGIISGIIRAPGLFLQRLTTREPDSGQLEVAIASLRAVAAAEEEEARGK